jgi:hypothetical protein
VSLPLRCPGCDAAYAEPERYCAACGLPLVHAPGVAPPPKSGPGAERARKVRAEFTHGELTRVTSVRHQAEAELVQNLLLEEGIPSLVRRTGGFDVPDFLAAGPRDVLVPRSGADLARALLRTEPADAAEAAARAARPRPSSRAPAWVRALAVVLAVVILAVVAAGVVGAIRL